MVKDAETDWDPSFTPYQVRGLDSASSTVKCDGRDKVIRKSHGRTAFSTHLLDKHTHTERRQADTHPPPSTKPSRFCIKGRSNSDTPGLHSSPDLLGFKEEQLEPVQLRPMLQEAAKQHPCSHPALDLWKILMFYKGTSHVPLKRKIWQRSEFKCTLPLTQQSHYQWWHILWDIFKQVHYRVAFLWKRNRWGGGRKRGDKLWYINNHVSLCNH